ncbi:AraC family transcriptional regulator [Candidatus Enterococcus ferrettii]|uniref:HTH araC/xylS-type domain-containing protein n=1 Tax=Candidatus Enterococcus ferrettii TaxID=2815324 RepID=A0ABV0EX87_9ENTE|nr:AraC family ligand binding domain-containing protein [Enterococcus sp. 665A]MBO1340863.1 AraC family ligand binding domain-containing protein [Enterococcus sp. 665A]
MEEAIFLVKRQRSDFKDFYFSFCGHSKTFPGHSFGPAVRDVFLIHIILEGSGYYSIKKTKYHLSKGQGFVIYPGESTFYQASEEQPWEYVWLAIGGDLIESYLANLGITPAHLSFEVTNSADFHALILQCLAYEQDTQLNELILQKIAYSFMELLSKSMVHTLKDSHSTKMNGYVLEALEIIGEHFWRNITVKEIAEKLMIDASYLSRLFKKDIGISIKSYINEMRISTSRDIIATTNLPISKIAEMIGFPTTQAFSKAFSKGMGLSPFAYRKERIGSNHEIS